MSYHCKLVSIIVFIYMVHTFHTGRISYDELYLEYPCITGLPEETVR